MSPSIYLDLHSYSSKWFVGYECEKYCDNKRVGKPAPQEKDIRVIRRALAIRTRRSTADQKKKEGLPRKPATYACAHGGVVM